MENKLLPCPFCGGEAKPSGERFENTILSWVYCTSCGAAGSYRHTVAEAIEAWNTRAGRMCSCGWHGFIDGWGYEAPNYCPNCGAKVVDE